jgi:hypothetical protein
MKIENVTYQNVWNTAKTDLRGKSIAENIHIKKEERHKINCLTLGIKELEK